jgi:Ca-activated chloride channel family protein
MAARMRRVLILVAGLAVVVVGAAAQPQTFRTGVAAVHLPVIVTARDGSIVRGLTASDFEVREAGRLQDIASFAEGPPGPDVPLHLALMMDTSESMEKELAGAIALSGALLDAVPEAADVTLVEFDATVRVSRYDQGSYPRLFERVRGAKLGQRTALFDAFGRYVALVRERPGQHLLIVCTDGADSGFSLDAVQVRDLVRLGDVIIYAMGFLREASAQDRWRQQLLLTGLARETGGEAFFPSGPSEHARIVAQIRAEIDGRYTLGYLQPPARARERFRKVDVRLARPDLKGARVRTRTGYQLLVP